MMLFGSSLRGFSAAPQQQPQSPLVQQHQQMQPPAPTSDMAYANQLAGMFSGHLQNQQVPGSWQTIQAPQMAFLPPQQQQNPALPPQPYVDDPTQANRPNIPPGLLALILGKKGQ
jgi:hypothetical protein